MKPHRYIGAVIVILFSAFVLNRIIDRFSESHTVNGSATADEVVTSPSTTADSTRVDDSTDFVQRIIEFETVFFEAQNMLPEEAEAAIRPYVTPELLSARDFGGVTGNTSEIDIRLQSQDIVIETDESGDVAYVAAYVTVVTSGDEAASYGLLHRTVWIKPQETWIVSSTEL